MSGLTPAEDWRSVRNYPGYEVNGIGEVRSWRSKSGRLADSPHLLKPSVNRGYLVVSPRRDGRNANTTIHRLVAAAFLGPRPEGMEIRHLDGNPQNNAASNLAYGTPAENRADQKLHGTDFQANKTHCPSGHPYDDENTYRDYRGKRYCKACIRIHQAKRPPRPNRNRRRKTPDLTRRAGVASALAGE